MAGLEEKRKPQAVLFCCAMNAIRSPMALALAKHYFGKSIYFESAGVHKGEHDGFVDSVMDEIGIDVQRHKPKTLEELEEWEGLNFDLIITLSPEAHHKALDYTRTLALDVEYWPMPDPSLAGGSRETILEAYRQVRDLLGLKIKKRFT
jgi:protein-tyrosine-phosphatase